jgi:hypothetical protein
MRKQTWKVPDYGGHSRVKRQRAPLQSEMTSEGQMAFELNVDQSAFYVQEILWAQAIPYGGVNSRF